MYISIATVSRIINSTTSETLVNTVVIMRVVRESIQTQITKFFSTLLQFRLQMLVVLRFQLVNLLESLLPLSLEEPLRNLSLFEFLFQTCEFLH